MYLVCNSQSCTTILQIYFVRYAFGFFCTLVELTLYIQSWTVCVEQIKQSRTCRHTLLFKVIYCWNY